jgi:hypothetical protein
MVGIVVDGRFGIIKSHFRFSDVADFATFISQTFRHRLSEAGRSFTDNVVNVTSEPRLFVLD